MPVQPCTAIVDGTRRSGRRWGKEGKCYPCSRDGDCAEAHRKAEAQGKAIEEEHAARKARKR